MSHSELDSGGGGGGSSTDDSTDSDDGTSNNGSSGSRSITGAIIASALAAWLEIETSTLRRLGDFLRRLSEAESFADLVINVVLTSFVGWILRIAEVIFNRLIESIELIAQALWFSTVVPVRIAFRSFAGWVFDALEAVQLTVESGLASAGLGAPLVALGGWVVVLLIVVILGSIVWAFLETYLPVEAVVDTLERLLDSALVPVRVVAGFASGAAAALRGRIGGDETE